jgi:hypothetical protein
MPLALYPLQLSPAALGQQYRGNLDSPLTPVGGTAPYTLAVSAGALPVGLSLNGTQGLIQGTPRVADAYDYKPTTAIPFVVNPSTFTITATDSLGATASNEYTLPVGVFSELQSISIYEMLDAAYGFDYYVVMSDMGSREIRIGDIGSPAFGGLRLVTNALLAQFTSGMIEVMLQHIHEWDMIKRIFMDQQGGSVSDVTGLNNKIGDRKSGLLRRFKNLLPAYTLAEVNARKNHGGGMDITSTQAGGGGNVEFVR